MKIGGIFFSDYYSKTLSSFLSYVWGIVYLKVVGFLLILITFSFFLSSIGLHKNERKGVLVVGV